ncbi:hypothetical protein F0L74_06945 [Chitinophaga agrisoli]|uniref:Mannosylglycerate hydrolase MGH1-like glycoside hydrolase domain-containing protein n=1 Tax=Chitinophaga agrisoli TaxID=2607653 RepID=A0A5B2W2T4_9BACT|nr:hypothetical protein [Chitinophaga agrisoli]KAA2245685.1 hypothetical protein F0L74_06945 [Chitinophaga agrisoli]
MKTCFARGVLLILLIIYSGARLMAQSKWQLSDFAIDLNRLVTPPNHLWVGSGYTSVNPVLSSVLGVGEVMSPPISGHGFKFEALFIANGDTIRDHFVWGGKVRNILYTGGFWQPDRIIRRGTYHRMHAGGLISFEINSHLIPLADKPGFLIRYEVRNRTTTPLQLSMTPLITTGKPAVYPLREWGFMPPADPANNDTVPVKVLQEGQRLNIAPQQSQTAYVAVVFTNNTNTTSIKDWENQTTAIWNTRLAWALKDIPTLTSNNAALESYYKRSIVSGLVCIWEKPEFKLHPTIVTSGLDGGGMNTYLWDVAGYAPGIVSMMMGNKLLDIARTMTAIDLERSYAFAQDGTGLGVRYAYSTVAFTSLVYAIACQDRVYPDLFEQVKKLVLSDEKRPMINGVIDYGDQHNLLEMRGMGWEHMVPSPNAERAWCFRRLADMGEKIGYDKTAIQSWRKKADTIAANIRQALWDDTTGWFACKYPDGHKETVYSIQVFDILRTGVCTPAMKKRMLEQLQDGKFLFPYGVSSVSKADSIHYEVTDTDWGGGGAYSGDLPQLALDLYGEHLPAKAWDVLKRQFWIGQQLPYFPQEHFCDRPGSPAYKRANVVSGLMGSAAILYGMVGLEPRLDGSLWIHPQPTADNNVQIKGFIHRDHIVDVQLSANLCKVTLDGKIKYQGKPATIKIF